MGGGGGVIIKKQCAMVEEISASSGKSTRDC